MSDEVWGKPFLSVAHLASCYRCSGGNPGVSIGNGYYCEECAKDIWENVGGQAHE